MVLAFLQKYYKLLTGESTHLPHKIARYGWIPSLPDQRDQLYTAPAPVRPGMLLPEKTDLRAGCPPIYDQGQLGSCTANAIAAAFDFERKHQDLPFLHPSRLFIYYNERALQGTTASDSGATIRDGMKVINTDGVCPESEWPYTPFAPESNNSASVLMWEARPWPKCYATALKDKCLNYSTLTIFGQSTSAIHNFVPALNATIQLRQCLASGRPFVFGFTVYESFESDQVAKTGIVPLPAPTEAVLGGHAVLCVGYNDKAQYFLCRNSWGTAWGQQGYFEMPYAYLTDPNRAADFWTIELVSK